MFEDESIHGKEIRYLIFIPPVAKLSLYVCRKTSLAQQNTASTEHAPFPWRTR